MIKTTVGKEFYTILSIFVSLGSRVKYDKVEFSTHSLFLLETNQ
jgi:hypothetical protein